MPGFDIAGWNRPADRTGGDFFDWLRLPNGDIAFGLADVTGHGIGPALIVSVVRAYFRACTTMDSGLEGLIARVNDLLEADLTHGRFVTAAIGVLNPASGQIRLYCAGHGPTFFFDAESGSVEIMGADDIPLGIFPERRWSTARELTMRRHDMLVLVTDGFHEWAGPDAELFGVPRMVEAIERHRGSGARELIDRLYQEVTQFGASTPQADDLTAIVVKRI